jgi:hypothetical protein
VRMPFVQEAVVRLDAGGDARAVGGAVTQALCGAMDHPPPCPVAAHHTRSTPTDEGQQIRVLFAADPEREGEARRTISAALSSGEFASPDGTTTRWELLSQGPGEVRASERRHAARLTAG